MIRRALLFLALVVLCAASIFAGQQREEGIEVTVEGYAPILDNKSRARDEAIMDALRRGVEQVLGGYLDSRTILHNFDLLEDSVLSQARGYVSSYSVKDVREDENLLIVIVAMVIKEDVIHGDLEGLRDTIKIKGNPRIGVVIPQIWHRQKISSSPAEEAVASILVQKGFEVVSKVVYADHNALWTLQSILDGDFRAASSLFEPYDVTYIVAGRASPIHLSTYEGLVSYRCLLEVQVILSELGTILSLHSTEAKGIHTVDSLAFERAATEAGNELAPEILTSLAKEITAPGHTIRVHVHNCSFADVSYLERRFKAIRLTQQVFFRSYEDRIAVFDVLTSLPTAHFAENLNWWQIGLQIDTVRSSTIVAAMQ